MRKSILFCLAVTGFSISSCTKNNPLDDYAPGPGPNSQFYYSQFDSVAIAYVNLRPNSNYIYKDQTNGLTDTVVVTASIKGFNNNYLFSEQYDLTCSIIPFNLPPTIWLRASAACDPNNGPAPLIYDADFELRNWQTNLPSFWYPLISSTNKQYTYIPSVVIEGITYNAVNKFQASNGLLPTQIDYLESTFYWVKGIGIVKKEIKTFNSVKTSLLVKYW